MKAHDLHRRGFLWFALPLLAASCAAPQPAEPDGSSHKQLPHQMVEVDRFGSRFTNTLANAPKLVDGHSQLIVEFPKLPTAEAEPLSNEWKDLLGTLKVLNEQAMEWKRINEMVAAFGDTNAERRIQGEAGEAATKAVSLLDDLEKLGMDPVQMRSVLSGRALGLTNRARTPYLNLAQWATNHWNELKAGAEKYQQRISKNAELSVTVQAFRESASGGSSLLHIPEWDQLEPGAYEPIDRTGFRPTTAEQKRLNMERQAATAAAAIINSALTNHAQLSDILEDKFNQVKRRIQRIAAEFEDLQQNWDEALVPGIAEKLEPLAASTNAAVAAAALDLRTNLIQINQWVAAVKVDIALARNLLDQFDDLRTGNPTELLLGLGGLRASVEKFVADARGRVAFVISMPGRLQNIQSDLQVLGPEMAEQVASLVDAELKSSLKQLQEKFPAEAENLATLWATANSALDSSAALEAIANADGKLISHPSDKLIPARLSLANSGLALDDLVTVTVKATNVVTGDIAVSETYQHKIGLMGFHGRPAVHLIFARALSGPDEATQWKANVAAAVEAHYTFRETDRLSKRFWNEAYPGIGVHVASLDQDQDSVEFGAGVNVTFWRGLIAGGVGYNFSAEREYVWVGVNLLGALNEAKGAFLKK
jgi:hypothetical protein